jgi:CBS domain-containing protein
MPTRKKPAAPIAETVMTRRVVACRPQTDLAHVARLMWENDCGCVPVVDGEDRVIGLVTDRDACMSAQFRGQPLRELTAGECMATEIACAAPGDSAVQLAQRMGERGVRRLPVTDPDGRLLGIVAVSDLFRALTGAGATARRELEKALLGALTRLTASRTPEVLEPAPRSAGTRAKRPSSGKGKSTRKPGRRARK